MNNLQDVKIIIPVLNPNENFLKLLDELKNQGFEPPIVVNDGSSSESCGYFQTAQEEYGCIVLEHEENKGKGCALKTAFSYILSENKYKYVVTIDADGQHEPEDVLACVIAAREAENSRKVMFGCRNFNEPQVPAKSRIGNKSMCILMRFACGMNLSDTQTGLRVFPVEYLPWLVEVEGERFEYETNVLIFMQGKEIPYGEVSVRTVYMEENKSSHFRPITDSLIIIRPFLKFLVSSFSSSLVDLAVFTLLFYLLRGFPEREVIWGATIAARALTACFNYLLNRHKVFEQGSGKSPMKYIALCILQMCMSAALVSAVFRIVGVGAVGIKIVVDISLFFVSYQIQREWVFSK